MKIYIRPFSLILIASFFFITNCASNKLSVTIDLYKGDLPIEPQSYEINEIVDFYNELNQLKFLSNKISEQKIQLSDKFFTTYKEYFIFYHTLSDSEYEYDEQELSGLKDEKIDYENSILEYNKRAKVELNRIRNLLDQIALKKTSSSNPLEIIIGINKSTSIVDSLSNYSNHYTEIISTIWKELILDLEQLIIDEGLTPDKESLDVLISSINSFTNELKKLEIIDSKNFQRLLEITNSVEENYDERSFLNANILLSNVFSNVPADMTSESRKSDLIKFANDKTFLFTQIDKIQDFGHKNWKVIASNSKNDNNWNTEFSKTYFEAQGNSSIVLVRDSPVYFRPQTVNNDPSSLIQSQLKVTRATVGLAISIGSALSGINLDDADVGVGSTPDNLSETKNGKIRLLEEELSFREKAKRSLIERLKLIKTDLEANGGTPAELTRIKQEIISLTEVYTKIFN